MARQIAKVIPEKTYKTMANLERAIDFIPDHVDNEAVRYIVCTTPEGRFYPIFIGQGAVNLHLFHKGFICAS